MSSIWAVFQSRVRFRVLFIGVPYYIGDLQRDPNLENYPCAGCRVASIRIEIAFMIIKVVTVSLFPKIQHSADRTKRFNPIRRPLPLPLKQNTKCQPWQQTHRLLSSELLWFIFRIRKSNPKKELLRSLWIGTWHQEKKGFRV